MIQFQSIEWIKDELVHETEYLYGRYSVASGLLHFEQISLNFFGIRRKCTRYGSASQSCLLKRLFPICLRHGTMAQRWGWTKWHLFLYPYSHSVWAMPSPYGRRKAKINNSIRNYWKLNVVWNYLLHAHLFRVIHTVSLYHVSSLKLNSSIQWYNIWVWILLRG